jgi:hypothetical protein
VGVKRLGHGTDYPPSSAKGKEEVELYLYPLSAFVVCSKGKLYLYYQYMLSNKNVNCVIFIL